ncbi:MAG TPA: hypothetical protein VGQ41_20540 [Pyrinomonadaceae bacterium]|jgi:Spy/CpxP family protein refolding chaperone|nr:hypothetical protein [Pyrinomonadaceae bacterium]
MKNRRIAVLLGVAMLAGLGLAGTKLGGRSTAANSVSQPPLAVNADSKESTGVPKHIAYGLFFGEMIALKKKATEREKQGIKSDGMRDFHKVRGKLSDYESQVLDQVASECNDKVVKINDQARATINRERARHPHGRLKDGEPLPLPPAALLQLEEQRKQTLLEAREQLRTILGQKDFDRIDNFIQQDIEARTKGSSRIRQQ